MHPSALLTLFLTVSNTHFGLETGHFLAHQRLGHGQLPLGVQMAVGVCRGLDVTVPQPFLYVFERKAHVQQIASGTVTELVKTDMSVRFYKKHSWLFIKHYL